MSENHVIFGSISGIANRPELTPEQPSIPNPRETSQSRASTQSPEDAIEAELNKTLAILSRIQMDLSVLSLNIVSSGILAHLSAEDSKAVDALHALANTRESVA